MIDMLVALFASIASAYPKKFEEGPLRHPDSGLTIITSGYNLYRQESFTRFFQLDADIAKGSYP